MTTISTSLDEATHRDGVDGCYTARLSRAWEIWGPNGRYLAAIALRVAGRVWDESGNLVASAASQPYCVANPDASA